ncbi:fluoride efflux transporter CrcB [Pontibacter roseus]|uniref:fluoride efflux transporter CrcB n=1 Tax=Pontibacter roseus TaxID=336989 RepID=UPI00035ED953|nr:fluoride efflux transporter CrcB [Pontibacter roseus]
MTREIILVGIGGGIGSALRYLTSALVAKHVQAVFPLGTFAVNVVGCLAIGLLLGLFERQAWANPDVRFFLVTGFCGGYTTFSAFAAENVNLLQSGHSFTAFLYIAASILVSLFAVWVGLALTR